jgi:hypothetical protein
MNQPWAQVTDSGQLQRLLECWTARLPIHLSGKLVMAQHSWGINSLMEHWSGQVCNGYIFVGFGVFG